MPVEESALVIPVSEAEPAVATWRAELDPAAERGIPAHITVLYPFAPPDQLTTDLRQRLGALLADVCAFSFNLAQVDCFADEVLFLAPEPPAPFTALSQLVFRAFPDWPPHGGEHAVVVPHLTVAQGAAPEQLVAATAALAPALPIAGLAHRVWLMAGSEQPNSWHRVAEFPLGDAAS